MSIRDEARQAAQEYAQRHVGGMQPVETIGDRVRAAFEAGAVWRDEQADREPSDDPCSCPSGDGSLRHPCQAHPGDTSDREG